MTIATSPGQRQLTASPDLSGVPATRRADARSLLWSITTHTNQAGQARPGLDLLQDETGLPETAIHAAAELLAARGVITVAEDVNGDDTYQVVTW